MKYWSVILLGGLLMLGGGCQLFDGEEKNSFEPEKTVKPEEREKWFQESDRAIASALLHTPSEDVIRHIAGVPADATRKFPDYLPQSPGTPLAEALKLGGEMPKSITGEEPVQTDFNFKNAAMADVIPVFATLLGFNFVIEGTLPGSVTMSMHEKIPAHQLWDILFQLLRLSGVAADFNGKILHLRSAAAVPQELTLDASGGHLEMGVFRLKNINVTDIAAQIKKFLPRDLRAIELARLNTLLILETPATLARLRVLIDELDQPAPVNLRRAVVPCKHVSAPQLVKELKAILPVLGFPVSDASGDKNTGAISLVALDRLGVVLIGAANEDAVREVERWMETLDREDSNAEQLYVYEVVNSRAEELVKALSVMYTVSGGMVGTTTSGEFIDTPNIGSASTLAKNSEVAPGSVFDVPVRIWADAINQRLTIRTTPRAYASIKAYLERIDTIPPQVLLQVLVVEINLSDSIEFGIEFMAKNSIGNFESVGGTDYKYLTPGTGQGQQYGAKYWLYNPDNPDEKFGYINALAGQSNVRVISSPQILIVNNQQATINVGDQVPVITSELSNSDSTNTTTTGTSTTLLRSVAYKDTGINLSVTPRITRGGRITMNISQEVSEAQTNTTSNIDSPQVQQRKVSTTMSLRNGQLLVCGGLIREKVQDNLDSIPVVSNIPFLRRLLGDTNVSTARTEMLVLITGTIVTEDTKLQQLVRGYQQSVDSLIEFAQPTTNNRKSRFKHNGDLDKWFFE